MRYKARWGEPSPALADAPSPAQRRRKMSPVPVERREEHPDEVTANLSANAAESCRSREPRYACGSTAVGWSFHFWGNDRKKPLFEQKKLKRLKIFTLN